MTTSVRDEAWTKMLLAARTRALARVIRERDHLRDVITGRAHLYRAGIEVHKLHAQGDELVRPSVIIATAEGETHDH